MYRCTEPEEWLPNVHHILESAESITEFVVDLTESDFGSDRRTLGAVQLEIVIIAEAAGRLPDHVRSQVADIPWHDIRGMRNIIVHEYDKVDFAEVWRVATIDMPVLISALRDVLKQHGEE